MITSKLLCVALLTIIDPLGNLSEILVRERRGELEEGCRRNKGKGWGNVEIGGSENMQRLLLIGSC